MYNAKENSIVSMPYKASLLQDPSKRCLKHDCTGSRVLLAASVCVPANRQKFIITNFREKKQASFELRGYGDQSFIQKLFVVEILYFALLRTEQTHFLHSINMSGKSEIFQ